MLPEPAGGGLSALPQDGLWRISVLVRRRDGTAENWLDEALIRALATSLQGETGLVRLVVDRPPQRLDPIVAGIFPPLFDALIELWFAFAAEAVASMARLDADPALAAVTGTVIDTALSVLWLAQAFPIKPEAGRSRVKLLAGGDVAEGWSIEAAQAYWRDVHPAVARTAPSVWGPLTRYVQFHGGAVPAGASQSVLGRWRQVPLCAEMGFAEERDFIASYSNAEYHAIVRPDEERFSRPGEALAFVSGEERVIRIEGKA